MELRTVRTCVLILAALVFGHFSGLLLHTVHKDRAMKRLVDFDALLDGGLGFADGELGEMQDEALQERLAEHMAEIDRLRKKVEDVQERLLYGEDPYSEDGEDKADEKKPSSAVDVVKDGEDDDQDDVGEQTGPLGVQGKVVLYGIAWECILNKPRRTDNKLLVAQDPCVSQLSKHFWIRDGTSIRSADTDECIDVKGLKPDVKGGQVILQPCSTMSPTQNFQEVPDESRPGWGLLRNPETGLCLELTLFKKYQFLRASKCRFHCGFLLAMTPAGHHPPTPWRDAVEAANKPEVTPIGQRVYCFVLTYPKSHDFKLPTVQRTWGKWCDKVEYISSETYMGLPVVALNMSRPESRGVIWEKTRLAWLRAYKLHVEDYDWFCKFDDDTFVNMDNLREYVSTMDPEDLHYLGRSFTVNRGKPGQVTYYSGGSGYILSRAALRKMGENGDTTLSGNQPAPEDLEFGRRAKTVGILTEDTRDEDGADRFMPLNIVGTRNMNKTKTPTFWYWRYQTYPTNEGYKCCSKKWVSSHYNGPPLMQSIYYAKIGKCEGSSWDTWSQALYVLPPPPKPKPPPRRRDRRAARRV